MNRQPDHLVPVLDRSTPKQGDSGAASIPSRPSRPSVEQLELAEPAHSKQELPSLPWSAPTTQNQAEPIQAARRAQSSTSPAGTTLCDLEQAVPHAVALLCRVWGAPEVGRALRALMLNDCGHVRKWRAEVWAELILLRNIHQDLHSVPSQTAGELVDPEQFSVLEVLFPHVVQRLLRCWGNTEAFAVVHHDLVIDDRGGRAGWPEEVWDDLVLLQQVHDKAHGRLPEGAEPWKSFFLKD